MGSCGLRHITIADELTGIEFPALVMYPSCSPETEQPLGQYTVCIALDGEISEGRFPLVVISHGSGGSPRVYRTLAAYLARHGFVVVSLQHTGNNRDDNSLAGTTRNLSQRPRHLSLAIDCIQHSSFFAKHLRNYAAGVIGHSMGGYTALAAAGGRVDAFAYETGSGNPMPVETATDTRIKAVVLLAPATVWFQREGALRDVHVPILMMTAEKDTVTPAFHWDIVKQGLPAETPLDHRVIANAGHFSFLSPFPIEMCGPHLPPSMDPEGFDRPGFHERMYMEIAEFLRQSLSV